MTLTIKIEMDNAAFGENDFTREKEVKRILSVVSNKIKNNLSSGSAHSLHDLNGNKCGFYGVDHGVDL